MKENKSERTEQWHERIQDYRSSGLTMKAWCGAQGIAFNQLKYWLRKLSPKTQKQASVNWMAVSPVPDASHQDGSLISVRVGVASIDVRPGFNPSLLGQVVQALASS